MQGDNRTAPDVWRPKPGDIVGAKLLRIPYGATCSYADLARDLGSVPRAVGQANGANPIPVVVPCHRVLNTGGGLGGYGGGLEVKVTLLRLEGAWI